MSVSAPAESRQRYDLAISDPVIPVGISLLPEVALIPEASRTALIQSFVSVHRLQVFNLNSADVRSRLGSTVSQQYL